MVWSIIVCLWIVFWAADIEHTLNHGVEDEAPFLSRVGKKGWIQAASLGVGVGLANYLAPLGAWSILCLILIIAVMVYIAVWFFKDVDRGKEWFLFFLMTFPMHFVLASAGAAVAGMVKSAFWHSVLGILPGILSSAFGGFMLTVLFFRFYENTEKTVWKVLSGVVLGLTILAMIVQIWSGVAWSSINWSKKTAETPAETTAPVETEPVKTSNWYYFYNTNMILDEDAKNDYNFGANPLEELAMARVKSGVLTLKDIAGKTEDELIRMVSVEELVEEFWRRMSYDPALGATSSAWTDVKLGTRYLGEFYEVCEQKWATTMNSAKESWMSDRDAYNRMLAAMRTFYSTAKSVGIVHVKGGLTDQMYMNAYTVDHIPDIIVMESADQEGYFLRFTFEIKGKEVNVDFRVECGFQPTNVAKLMNIPAQTNPNKPTPTPTPPPTTDPGKPSGGDPGKPSGGDPDPGKPAGGDPGKPSGGDPDPGWDPPGPGPSPKPDPKDPREGASVGGNENPGPGGSTNNGVGAMYSSEENSNNSAFDTYEEYQQEMQELAEANANQAVGGDPNTPSYTPPGSNNGGGTTTVDSNADSGTGNGGIDAGTPTHNTNVDSNVGGSTSTSDDPVGTEWGGPPD